MTMQERKFKYKISEIIYLFIYCSVNAANILFVKGDCTVKNKKMSELDFLTSEKTIPTSVLSDGMFYCAYFQLCLSENPRSAENTFHTA